MASRGGGSRPVGTDGNDFMHREKVANQYTISAETKKYVKYSIWMHFMISMIVVVQIGFYYGAKYTGSQIFPDVPKPQIWQYIWLTSLVPGMAGYLSLNRSVVSLMSFYYYGTVFLGLLPVLITMIANATDLLEYAQTKKSSNTYHEFPVIIIWYAYLFVAIQIHAFGIYFSRVLLKLWKKDSGKKRN